jgi:hypothetical protein
VKPRLKARESVGIACGKASYDAALPNLVSSFSSFLLGDNQVGR